MYISPNAWLLGICTQLSHTEQACDPNCLGRVGNRRATVYICRFADSRCVSPPGLQWDTGLSASVVADIG